MNVVHDTFTLERTLDATPERVFQALSVPEHKAQWFTGPDAIWTQKKRVMDFRIGGREQLDGRFESGMESSFDATYLDVVANERIVYVYEMSVNGRKISASLATFELFPEGPRTRLRLTEQGAYFHDPNAAAYAPDGQAVSRKRGTEGLLGQLAVFCSG